LNVFHIGETQVELIVAPDKARFTGIITDADDIAIYVNGLGFPREDIVSIEPL
jgi:hypothetical protein